jgi:hypothetical protein
MSLHSKIRTTVSRTTAEAVAEIERRQGPFAARLYREAFDEVQQELEDAIARCDVTRVLAIRNRVERNALLRIVEMKGRQRSAYGECRCCEGRS